MTNDVTESNNRTLRIPRKHIGCWGHCSSLLDRLSFIWKRDHAKRTIEMAHQRRILRETPGLQPIVGQWSRWYTILVPDNRGHEGMIDDTNLNALRQINCCIYEWRAVRGNESYVVYIGSTCRNSCRRDSGTCPCTRRCSLYIRVNEYATTGSHKERLIDDALEEGFRLQVRYNICETPKEAHALENDHLDEFDYAWNKRRNGRIRRILQEDNRRYRR